MYIAILAGCFHSMRAAKSSAGHDCVEAKDCVGLLDWLFQLAMDLFNEDFVCCFYIL